MRDMVATGKAVQMMICLKENDKAVGSVYIRDIDPGHQKGEYGIFIGEEDARGCGIGTEAARQMIRYAFDTLGLHRLFLRAFADNRQAIASYEKAGFKQEAYLREDVCIDGIYRDMVLMGIVNQATEQQEEKREFSPAVSRQKTCQYGTAPCACHDACDRIAFSGKGRRIAASYGKDDFCRRLDGLDSGEPCHCGGQCLYAHQRLFSGGKHF